MTPDHEAALAKCKAWPHKSNTAACYLDAMAGLKTATELIEKLLEGYHEEYWGPSPDETEKAARAFLARHRKTGANNGK